MILLTLILPLVAGHLAESQVYRRESSTLPSTIDDVKNSEIIDANADYSRVKRGHMVMDAGPTPKLVSPEELNNVNKRSVDKLSEADKSTSLDGDRETRSTSSSASDEEESRSSEIEDDMDDTDATPSWQLTETEVIPTVEGSGELTPEAAVKWSFSRHVTKEDNSDDVFSAALDLNPSETPEDAEGISLFEGSGEVVTESPIKKPRWAFIKHVTAKGNGEEKIRTARLAFVDLFSSATEAPKPIEGSGDSIESIREVRQAVTQPTDVVLGVETPVSSSQSSQNSLIMSQKRPGGDWDDRRPTSNARPDTLTCETVDCIRGTQCMMENGRPTCRPIRGEPSQRTCRDINCPRDSRCRMEQDPRCRGRDCNEEPVCVRESSRASCSSVQCPSGTRCSLIEEPGCRFNCREIATCTNSCDGVRCPSGSACRFDGRDSICAPIALDACLSARCPGGFECRTVQNKARCFPVNTPAPTLPPTTTPAPALCFGQNEEFATCATFCEATCVEKNPPCILACAAPRCQCSAGFYRNQQGVCVPSEQCEFIPTFPTCAVNEIFNQCSTPCEPKCGQPVQLACPAICGRSKCQCKPGFWRHPSGSCVQQNHCFFG